VARIVLDGSDLLYGSDKVPRIVSFAYKSFEVKGRSGKWEEKCRTCGIVGVSHYTSNVALDDNFCPWP